MAKIPERGLPPYMVWTPQLLGKRQYGAKVDWITAIENIFDSSSIGNTRDWLIKDANNRIVFSTADPEDVILLKSIDGDTEFWNQ